MGLCGYLLQLVAAGCGLVVACWGFVDLLFDLLVFSIGCLLWVMVALWFLRVGCLRFLVNDCGC